MFKALIGIVFVPAMILGMEFTSNEISEAPTEIKIDAPKKEKISFCCIDKLQDLAARTYLIRWNDKHLDLIEKLHQFPTGIASRIANQKDLCGNTLLHTAAYLGSVELVEYLLKKLNVNKHPNNKWLETPLIVAARQGHISICRLLYTPDAIETFHFTDLRAYIHRIPGADAISFEKEFLDNEPRPMVVAMQREDLCDEMQQRLDPQHLPFSEGNAQIIAHQEHNCRNTYLHTAAYLGNVKFVHYLLSLGCDKQATDIWDETPLLVAAKQGHITVCRLLYNPEAIESSHFNTLCQYVLCTPGEDAENFVQEHCKEYLTNLPNESKLEFSALKGDYTTVQEYLPSIYSFPNKDIIIINAINARLSNIISLLCNCDNQEISQWRKDDLLSLYMATLCGNTRITYILKAGGFTCSEALSCAIRQNNKRLIKLYLKKFPKKLNSLGVSNHTPLFYACLLGNFDLVEKLLKKGAQVNVDGEFHTALYAAITQKHYLIVQLLMKNNAPLAEEDMIDVRKIMENDELMKELLAERWPIKALDDLI